MVLQVIKWIKFGRISKKIASKILDNASKYIKNYDEDFSKLIEQIKLKASIGYLPDPVSIEELAEELRNKDILLLAALSHKEMAYFISAIALNEGKYVKTAFGAFIKAISLLLGIGIE